MFSPAPPATRKVVLSTNLAETSVTVAGVRFIVDCGLSKQKLFRAKLGLQSLLVTPISKSSAIQRAGRAGREAVGKCYRLYPEAEFNKLNVANVPEILRCDLAQAILNLKARGIDDLTGFPFLDKPRRQPMEKALVQLCQLGTLDAKGHINDLGRKLAKMPLSPRLGRVLAAAEEMDCMTEMIDLISCLTVENIFLNVTGDDAREKAETARRMFLRREGDHLTLLAIVRSYAEEQTNRKAWAEKHFVSHRALQSVMVRRSNSSWIYAVFSSSTDQIFNIFLLLSTNLGIECSETITCPSFTIQHRPLE